LYKLKNLKEARHCRFLPEFHVFSDEFSTPIPPSTNLVFPVQQASILSIVPFHHLRKPGHCHVTDKQLKLAHLKYDSEAQSRALKHWND
jgi:hypothetical protein